MERHPYLCAKCGNREFESDEIRTTGNGFSRFFDVQNRKFTVVSCKRCGYCELYKQTTSTMGNVLDFLVSG